jgi:hypothetical protein
LARREVAKRASSSQIVSRSSQRERRFAEARGGPIRPLAQSQPLGSLPKLVTAARPTHNARLAGAAPKRTTVFLGATIVVVFLATILTLSLFDGAAARSSSAQTTRITRVGGFSGPTPSVHPARSVALPAVPKPDSTRPEVVALDPQMAASSTPIADPSTFGSEAFEPIYSN